MKTVKDYIRTIVDFPHEGIMFRDVTTLFADPRGFRMCIDQMLHPYAGQPIDKVVGLEARGFILGGAIAHQLGTGFVPVRKKANCPAPPFRKITNWNTAKRSLKSMTTRSKRASVSWLLMIYWPQAARRGGHKLIERLGGDIVGCSLLWICLNWGRKKLQSMNMDVQVLCEFDGL